MSKGLAFGLGKERVRCGVLHQNVCVCRRREKMSGTRREAESRTEEVIYGPVGWPLAHWALGEGQNVSRWWALPRTSKNKGPSNGHYIAHRRPGRAAIRSTYSLDDSSDQGLFQEVPANGTLHVDVWFRLFAWTIHAQCVILTAWRREGDRGRR